MNAVETSNLAYEILILKCCLKQYLNNYFHSTLVESRTQPVYSHSLLSYLFASNRSVCSITVPLLSHF